MFCAKCGQKLIENSAFCGHCGAKAAQQTKETELLLTQQQAPPEYIPVPAKAEAVQATQTPLYKKRRMWIPLCAAVVVTLAAGTFFVLQSGMLPFGGQAAEELYGEGAVAAYTPTPALVHHLAPYISERPVSGRVSASACVEIFPIHSSALP